MTRSSIPMCETQSRSLQLSANAHVEGGSQGSLVTSNDRLIAVPELHERIGFLRWLFILIRQKSTWSPAVIAGEFWRFLLNIGAQREIFRLLKLRPFAEIAQSNPAFVFKYLVPNYLVRGFTSAECAASFLHHHRRVYAALPESVLRQIAQGYVTLHEFAEGPNHFALTMALTERIAEKEGELSLDLRVDDEKVFNLSFIIVPGCVVKSEAAEVLLITHLKGMKGCDTQIKLARKAFHDYSPRAMLLAALQGIADGFGINEIHGVCATKQRSYTQESSAILRIGYDEFFAKSGMVKTAAGFYASLVPIEGKPLASFKGRARSRARKRRAMRQQTQSACAAFLVGVADRAANSPSGAVNSTPVGGAVESKPSPISCP
jgi:uncharacterized protein VirK/YbjX